MPSSGGQTCARSEEHTSELQSHDNLVCRLLLGTKKTRGAPRRPSSTRRPPAPPYPAHPRTPTTAHTAGADATRPPPPLPSAPHFAVPHPPAPPERDTTENRLQPSA